MEKYYYWFRKEWLNVLIVSYILFIIYTTVVPFNFVFNWPLLSHRLSRIDWIPFVGRNRILERSDIVANIIFFVPLGILLGLKKIVSYYRCYTPKEWLTILGVGCGISATVEFLQLFTMDRHTSLTDIITNSGGTLIGASLILLIYLKFHQRIKMILMEVFFGKPEMSIAAILAIFIFLSYSLPFTYEINISSVLQSYHQFQSSSFRLSLFLLSGLSSMLMYGTMFYFLLSGLHRYWWKAISNRQNFYILLAVFVFPLLLEFYQFILPIRGHSYYDILAAWIGLLSGMGFFIIQKYGLLNTKLQLSHNMNLEYLKKYKNYFNYLLAIYLIYGIIYFQSLTGLMEFQMPASSTAIYHERYWRLQLFMHFNKEVFTFLPAGFILTFIHSEWKSQIWKILAYIFLLILILYYLFQSFRVNQYFFLSLVALSLGSFFGHFFWKIFKFLIIRHAPHNEKNR